MRFITLIPFFFISSLWATPTAASKMMDALLTAYYPIQEQLVKSDQSEAQKLGPAFLQVLTESTSRLETTTHDSLLRDAQALIQAENLDDTRLHFMRISQTLISMIEVSGVDQVSAYQVRCECMQPYFPADGATWLQATEQIYNPYWGSRMLHCGLPEAEYSAAKPTPE